MSIKIIVTGGTIDKKYNQFSGELDFSETHIFEMLKLAKCKNNCDVKVVIMKDSLDINNQDRQKVLKECLKSKKDKIIITHGTDTIVETAKVLANKIKNKTIVLFGAMIPYSFGKSGAMFNLGFATSAVQLLPHGVYVAMNGQIFNWNNVKKNKKIGEFVKIKK